MTKTTNQRRTATSILNDISQRLLHEQTERERVQRELFMIDVRITTLQTILDEADNSGRDDED